MALTAGIAERAQEFPRDARLLVLGAAAPANETNGPVRDGNDHGLKGTYRHRAVAPTQVPVFSGYDAVRTGAAKGRLIRLRCYVCSAAQREGS